MYKLFLLFCFLFLSSQFSYSQEVIRGKVVSTSEDVPVIYCTIQDLSTDEKVSSSANEKGEFSFSFKSKPSAIKLYLSSLGFADTLVILDLTKSIDHIIKLRPVSIQLSNVVISAKRAILKTIGSENEPFRGRGSGGTLINGSSVFVKYKERKDGVLNSIAVYLSGEGDGYKGTFTLRIFKMAETYKNFRAFATSDLQDVLSEKLVFEASKPGWFTIDLADHGVPITEDGLYIVLLPVLNSKVNYGKSSVKPEDRAYGPVIARQKLIKSSFRSFLYGPKTSGMGVYELQPAMIVKYSIEK